MVPFLCPVCGNKLISSGRTFSCTGNHSFDVARSGYVNLLMNSCSGRHGDDKRMVKARTQFLDKEYYAPLADRLAAIAEEASPALLLDAGCGEGYYTEIISRTVPGAGIIGLDISKDAVAAAAKRCGRGRFAVASTASMPLPDECADMILNVFSPFFPKEFHRVLRPGALLLRVIPLEKHLHELRQLVYDAPYDNTVPALNAEGFALVGKEELRYSATISDKDDLLNLFMMTPYYYKTSAVDQEKLFRAGSLETQIEFGILQYRKL